VCLSRVAAEILELINSKVVELFEVLKEPLEATRILSKAANAGLISAGGNPETRLVRKVGGAEVRLERRETSIISPKGCPLLTRTLNEAESRQSHWSFDCRKHRGARWASHETRPMSNHDEAEDGSDTLMGFFDGGLDCCLWCFELSTRQIPSGQAASHTPP
jgi:hypothetical protein